VTVDEEELVVVNGHASEPQFKLMTGFVILESDDGGVWLAEKIR
jgi:hypothetical protein